MWKRPNLRLETGCLVETVVFDGRRATGVRWRQGSETRTARCQGEVILAAGSIGSPHIMLLSGIGRRINYGSTASRWCWTGPASAPTCTIICSFG